MNAVNRALWYVETHFGRTLTLDDVAGAVGMSRFQLSRLFTFALGRTFTDYLRGRRLTEAARLLADGAPDILSVALDAGYNSHEAFSRAFRAHFGVTPESVRGERSLEQLDLVEAIRMPDQQPSQIAQPEIRTTDSLLIVGMQRYFTYQDRGGIPALWQSFGPHLGNIPDEVSGGAYGVCTVPASGDEEDGFDYLAGVAVQSTDDLPSDMVARRMPAQRWAVFRHDDHVSSIGRTCAAAAEWLSREGYKAPGGPIHLVEFYGPQFDPNTGNGGCEVWMPLSS